MDLSSLARSLQNTLGESLPSLLFALAILAGGWLAAVIVRVIVRRALKLLKLNARLQSAAGSEIDYESGAAAGAFYLVFVMALIAFFDALNLQLVSTPLQSLMDKVMAFLPHLVAGGVLILVAWLLATVLRQVVTKALGATKLDEKLSAEAGMKPMSDTAGKVLYGLVLLLFLPAILGALKLDGLLNPVRDMVNEVLGVLPNLFTAVVFAVVGWFVARLLRNMVSALLEAAGTDKLGERAGLDGKLTLSKLIGLIVFILVFVPALIQAFDVLSLDAISGPATEVLATFMAALPKVFGAAVILGVAFFVSAFLADLATSLLGAIGFDKIPKMLGLASVLPGEAAASKFAGRLIVFFVMLFATVEAASVLGFGQVAGFVETFIEFAGQVLLGVAIIGIGVWLANIAHGALSGMNRPQASLMAGFARFAILGIVFAMGLRAMDLANEIVEAAFYLTLGAVAVAFALSFGLGGREAAGKQMEHWLSKMRGN